MSDCQEFIRGMRVWWEKYGVEPAGFTAHLVPPFVQYGVPFREERRVLTPPFSGRWKLRNGKVARITDVYDGGTIEGKVDGMPETVSWDKNGNAVLAWTHRGNPWPLSNGYDLMERIREGAGQ